MTLTSMTPSSSLPSSSFALLMSTLYTYPRPGQSYALSYLTVIIGQLLLSMHHIVIISHPMHLVPYVKRLISVVEHIAASAKPLALALIWPFLFLALGVLGIFPVEIGWIAWGESASQAASASDIVLVVVNLLSGIWTAWMQVLGIAVYRMIARGEPDLIVTFS